MSTALTAENVLAVVRASSRQFVIQPKLNGDRVILRKVNGALECWNRHQSRYSFNVNALLDWADLPEGTTLDGEGYRGHFYPFEAVIDGATVEERVAEAKRLCRVTGNAWIFETPTEAWLQNLRGNLPQWEGIVLKERGSVYRWCSKPNHVSFGWFKCKW